MRKPATRLRRILLLSLSAIGSLASVAHGASVDAVSGDATQILPALNQQYIHSRHAGTMPYWGDCYRCKIVPQEFLSPTCAANTPPAVLASWTTSGTSSCGGTEENVFTATTNCLTNGSEAIDFTEKMIENPGASNQSTESLSANYTLMNGLSDVTGTGPVGECSGDTGENTDFTCSFGQNSCNAGFDWYPSITIDGTEGQGSFNGTVTFTNALDPSSSTSKSFDVQFENYITQQDYECKHYPPTSTECQSTGDAAATVGSGGDLYEWPCNTQEPGWNVSGDNGATGADYCNGYLKDSQWIFASGDAATEPPQAGYSVMETKYENPTGADQSGTMYLSTDGAGWVWINGQQVAYVNGNGTAVTETGVELPPGTDDIVFMVQNIPDCAYTDQSACTNKPAAGILSILEGSDNMVVVNSNTLSWYAIASPPATPNPTQQSLMPAGWTPVNCGTQAC